MVCDLCNLCHSLFSVVKASPSLLFNIAPPPPTFPLLPPGPHHLPNLPLVLFVVYITCSGQVWESLMILCSLSLILYGYIAALCFCYPMTATCTCTVRFQIMSCTCTFCIFLIHSITCIPATCWPLVNSLAHEPNSMHCFPHIECGFHLVEL